jgi:hypothetical protein
MNTDFVNTMNIDQSLLFAHEENEIILDVNEEEAQQLLQENELPTTSTSTTTTTTEPPNIANDLTTINAKDFGSANFPHLIMIKAAYAVRNVAFQNESSNHNLPNSKELSHKRIMVGRTTETSQNDDPTDNTLQLGKSGACIGTHEPALVLFHHWSSQLPSSEKD